LINSPPPPANDIPYRKGIKRAKKPKIVIFRQVSDEKREQQSKKPKKKVNLEQINKNKNKWLISKSLDEPVNKNQNPDE
jgi:hypothetical protein